MTTNQNPLAALVAAMKPTPEQLASAARALTDQQLAALISGACSNTATAASPPPASPTAAAAPRPHPAPRVKPKTPAAPVKKQRPAPAKAKAAQPLPQKDIRPAYELVYEELVGHPSVSIPEVMRWTGLERHRIEHALRRMVLEGKAFRSGGRGLGGAHFAVTQGSADISAAKAAEAAQAAQAAN